MASCPSCRAVPRPISAPCSHVSNPSLRPLGTETCITHLPYCCLARAQQSVHALVRAGVQHTSSVHAELSLPMHLWLSHVIQFDGNELQQCTGTPRAAGTFPRAFLLVPEHRCSLIPRWSPCSSRAACSLLHKQPLPLSCCSNDVYQAHTPAFFRTLLSGGSAACSSHSTKPWLLLPATAGDYPPSPAASSDNCPAFNWRVL